MASERRQPSRGSRNQIAAGIRSRPQALEVWAAPQPAPPPRSASGPRARAATREPRSRRRAILFYRFLSITLSNLLAISRTYKTNAKRALTRRPAQTKSTSKTDTDRTIHDARSTNKSNTTHVTQRSTHNGNGSKHARRPTPRTGRIQVPAIDDVQRVRTGHETLWTPSQR